MKIFKYKIDLTETHLIKMPKGAKVLDVQLQDGFICMWAMVELDGIMETRTFRLYGTGHEMKENGKFHTYIGTFQYNGFVGHLFEIIELY